MPVKQGDLSLLQHPASQQLLQSKIPARFANVWTDSTPRVIRPLPKCFAAIDLSHYPCPAQGQVRW
jgi:hypothetical protein